MAKGGAESKDNEDGAGAKRLNEPVIITHQSGDGSRLENKNSVDKIPYMHRNPAV